MTISGRAIRMRPGSSRGGGCRAGCSCLLRVSLHPGSAGRGSHFVEYYSTYVDFFSSLVEYISARVHKGIPGAHNLYGRTGMWYLCRRCLHGLREVIRPHGVALGSSFPRYIGWPTIAPAFRESVGLRRCRRVRPVRNPAAGKPKPPPNRRVSPASSPGKIIYTLPQRGPPV